MQTASKQQGDDSTLKTSILSTGTSTLQTKTSSGGIQYLLSHKNLHTPMHSHIIGVGTRGGKGALALNHPCIFLYKMLHLKPFGPLTCVCSYTPAYTCTSTHAQTHTHTYTDACIHTHTHTHTHRVTHTHTHTHRVTRTHAPTHPPTYTHTHTHTHMQTPSNILTCTRFQHDINMTELF